ncbi:MAG: hypothetical protein U0Q18_05180 [Bryobacteraceae bacterium]
MNAFLTRALVFAFPCVAVAQIAILQIKVLEGDGAVYQPGTRVSHPLSVEITDEMGRPVSSAAVSFQLPPEGASGTFSNGLRTDLVLTDARGRAVVHSLQLNRTGGQFRIRVTAVKEQARAGIVTNLYIAENRAANPSHLADKANEPTKDTPQQSAGPPSTRITPTTAKMGRHLSKKWIILAVVAAGGGAVFAGVSRSSGASQNTGGSSSGAVSMGTPTITVGHP